MKSGHTIISSGRRKTIEDTLDFVLLLTSFEEYPHLLSYKQRINKYININKNILNHNIKTNYFLISKLMYFF